MGRGMPLGAEVWEGDVVMSECSVHVQRAFFCIRASDMQCCNAEDQMHQESLLHRQFWNHDLPHLLQVSSISEGVRCVCQEMVQQLHIIPGDNIRVENLARVGYGGAVLRWRSGLWCCSSQTSFILLLELASLSGLHTLPTTRMNKVALSLVL